MALEVTPVKDITPATKYPWTVKIVVLEKSFPRESQKSPFRKTSSSKETTPKTKFQRLILADTEGTRVQLSIFGKDIDAFEDDLLVGSKYYISNCRVATIEPQYRIVPHPYQWTLSAKCGVKPVPQDDPMTLPMLDNFISFDKLEPYIDDPDKTVDIIGIALHIYPVKELKKKRGPGIVKLQELLVINTEFKPIIVNLWSEFLINVAPILAQVITTKPVIVARHLQVGSYNGIKLSTNNQSTIAINPNTPEAHKVKTWLSANTAAINEFMASKTFQSFGSTSRNSAPAEITFIESLHNLPNNKNYSLRCTLKVTDLYQSFYYMTCSFCRGTTFASFMENYRCNYCKCDDIHAIPRCCLHVTATDSTGTITGIMFGEDAEKFLACDAVTLMKNLAEDSNKEISSVIKCESDGDIHIIVKPYENKYKGETTRKFNLFYQDATTTPTTTTASPSTPTMETKSEYTNPNDRTD